MECVASLGPWQPWGARGRTCHWTSDRTPCQGPWAPGCSLGELLSLGGDGGLGALGKQSQRPPVEWRKEAGVGTDSLR